MSEYSQLVLPPSTPELSGAGAVIGIGETDFHLDYRAERARAPGYEPPTPEGLIKIAFARALADCGLRREDIDGLALSFTYGGPDPSETADLLGIKPRHAFVNGNIMAGPLPVVCAEIAAGNADVVAMVYAVASRAIGRQYGGNTYVGGQGGPSSYYYYHPWGWSSQAAHWATMFRYYQAEHGASEEDLGAIAVQIRQHACANGNAVMQTPITIEDYMRSRYVVRPMHLFDMCLVNDGAVCLIVSRADKARELRHAPVLVSGWGEASNTHRKMECLVRDRLRPLMQQAGRQALDMAGLALDDIGHFEGYDSSTMLLLAQIEGYGFAPPGQGIAFCRDGQMTKGGRIPCNTSGGNLSASYMHGWSQVVEVVRQLRHEAGEYQVPGLRHAMSSLMQTDQAHPMIFTRGEPR